jgi:hypothetical protein
MFREPRRHPRRCRVVFLIGLSIRAGQVPLEDRAGDVAHLHALIGQQLLCPVEIFLRRDHQILAPCFTQFAPTQFVAGNEGDRLIQIGGELIGDDPQVKAMRWVRPARRPSGHSTHCRHALDQIPPGQSHFRAYLRLNSIPICRMAHGIRSFAHVSRNRLLTRAALSEARPQGSMRSHF